MDGPKMNKRQPPIRARVLNESNQHSNTKEINTDALNRIRKAFDLAADSPYQSEAAIKCAHKLMQKHNISRADVYENAKTPEEKAKLAGETVVRIERNEFCKSPANGGSAPKPLNLLGWFSKVGSAISVVFDCKFFTTRFTKRGYIHFTFFGIAENAGLAAEAFEIAFNVALDLAQTAKGKKQDFLLGFSDGLHKNAYNQRNREMDEAKDAETKMKNEFDNISKKTAVDDEKSRRIEMLRLQGLITYPEGEDVKVKEEERPAEDKETSPSHDSVKFKAEPYITDENDAKLFADNGANEEDSDSEHEDLIAGDAPDQGNAAEPATHIEEDDSADAVMTADVDFEALLADAERDLQDQKRDSYWKNRQQLTLFRSNASEIAKQWEDQRKQELKLKKGRKSTAKIRDYGVYAEGKKQGLDHDVKRRRLDGPESGNTGKATPEIRMIA